MKTSDAKRSQVTPGGVAWLVSALSSLVFARLRSSSLGFARLRSSSLGFARLRSSSLLLTCLRSSSPDFAQSLVFTSLSVFVRLQRLPHSHAIDTMGLRALSGLRFCEVHLGFGAWGFGGVES